MTDSTTHLADLLSTTDEIEITTSRGDGSPRAWVPIWFVALDEHVFVRSYRGTDGAWYRHATASGDATIRTGAGTYQVSVEPIGEADRRSRPADRAHRPGLPHQIRPLPQLPAAHADQSGLGHHPATRPGLTPLPRHDHRPHDRNDRNP